MRKPTIAFADYLADLPDPRLDRTKKHMLGDILAIAVCAVIAGADGSGEIETFGKARHAWLRRFLALPNGIPSHDTFNRVFAALDRKAFAERFGRWTAALCEAVGLRPIAIDGKAVRSAPRDTFSGCLHLVGAWAAENRLILGQEAVADGSHEIAAIPALLEMPDLKGALATIDAAGCQVGIARQIRRRKGHYLLAVKGDQPGLQEAVHAVSDRACAAGFVGVRHDAAETAERGHGRREARYVTVIYDPEGLPPDWPDAAAVVLAARDREAGGTNTATDRFSITGCRGRASALGRRVRGHWGIENGLHRVLDVAFREDANRTRAGNAGANLGMARRIAASLPKQDPAKGSIKGKRLRAALDESYLLQVLQGFQQI